MKRFSLLLICLSLVALVGCMPPKEYNLETLLPSEEGFIWQYTGIAGYGHSMELDNIDSSGDDEVVYTVTGKVDDVSGGESQADYNINLKYFLRDDSLVQIHSGDMMLDIPYQQVTLIKKPFEAGATWKQEVELTDDGTKLELSCEITEVVEEEGIKKYTVIYRNPDKINYEKRVIADGQGVIEYLRTIPGNDDQPVEIGYELAAPTSE